MSFYSLSFPPKKSALCICYKDEADEAFQQKVQSMENSGYETGILKLHTRFNPGKQIETYIGREYRTGVDYLYFKEPSKQFVTSENIQGFTREVMIKICQAVKDRGMLEIHSNGRRLWARDLRQFCAPHVIISTTVYYDQEAKAEVADAIRSQDIEQIKRFCERGDLFEQVLSSDAVSTEALSDLFMKAIQDYEKNEEEWGGFLDPDFDEDPDLDEIVQRMLTHCRIPDYLLGEALQGPAKHGSAKIVSMILSTKRVSPDALGHALTLAVGNGHLEVARLLLKAPNAGEIPEEDCKTALADAVVWLPSGGFVAQALCNMLLKSKLISKKGLQEMQKKMEELNDHAAAAFLEEAIEEADIAPGKAFAHRALSSSDQF